MHVVDLYIARILTQDTGPRQCAVRATRGTSVTFREAGRWQTVLDEQHAAVPGPALMKVPYPKEMGPFKIGQSVAQTSSACTAAGGRYAPPAAVWWHRVAPSTLLL
jgi:hypothetical protein